MTDLSSKNKDLLDSSEQLRNNILKKEREIESLNNDLTIVTQQNRSFTQEIERLSHLNLQMKMNITNSKEVERDAMEKEKVKEMQLNDVIQAYRKCAEENEILKRNISDVKGKEGQLYENLKRAEKNIELISAEKNALAMKQKQHLQEIGGLEQHLQHMNRELEMAHLKLGNLESTNGRLQTEQHNIIKVTQQYQNTNEDFHKKLSANQAQAVYPTILTPYLLVLLPTREPPFEAREHKPEGTAPRIPTTDNEP